MKTIICILISATTCFAAEVIELKDGRIIQGRVLAVVPSQVEIETDGQKVIVLADDLAIQSQRKVLGREADAVVIRDAYLMINSLKKLVAAMNQSLRLKGDPGVKDIQSMTAPLDLPQPIKYRVNEVVQENDQPSASGEMPSSALAKVKANAAADHPGDPSTQLYVVQGHIDAWKKLQDFPASPAKRKAETDHPYDFSTQLYIVEEAKKAQDALSGIR